jgi:hypothetical protein
VGPHAISFDAALTTSSTLIDSRHIGFPEGDG